jgi:hypothetical protein
MKRKSIIILVVTIALLALFATSVYLFLSNSQDAYEDISISYQSCTLDEEESEDRTIIIRRESSLDSTVNAFETDGSPFEGGVPLGEPIKSSGSGLTGFISGDNGFTRIPQTKDCVSISQREVDRLKGS